MWRKKRGPFSGRAERQLDGFEALAREHAPVLFRYVRMRTASDAEAEDLTQDILLRAFERRDQLREQERFLPWLLTIARHTALNEWRRPHRRNEVPLIQEGADGAEDDSWTPSLTDESAQNARKLLARHELAERIDEAIRQLDPVSQEVFLLRYYAECGTAEIAQRLGLPVGTVTAKLCRGLKAIRLRLERQGVSEQDWET